MDSSAHSPSQPTDAEKVTRQANRDAIGHVHEAPAAAVPEPEVKAVATEELAEHSPDGRPADEPSRVKGRTVLAVLLALGLVPVLIIVVVRGGGEALLMGLVYVAVLAFVAFPVWYSGKMRKDEELEARDIVRHTLEDEHAATGSHAGHIPPNAQVVHPLRQPLHPAGGAPGDR